MASPPADLDASLGTSLDFEFGNDELVALYFTGIVPHVQTTKR